jgi:Leucine-rich repeat (LRR) protein
MQTLMELYLGNNQIDEIKEVINLKELQRLIILDISGNNLIKEENYRIYCIFHLRRLRVLDGLSIENSECVEAKETFAGRLTNEILEGRLGGFTTKNIKELDLTSCKLRDFDKMFDRDQFDHLRELNLSHNFFASLRGFGYLPTLRILKIKQNRLESLFCKLNDDGYPRGLFGLHCLEVLDVSYNNLHDLYGL